MAINYGQTSIANIKDTPAAITDDFANRPLAGNVLEGTLFFSADTTTIYQSINGVWNNLSFGTTPDLQAVLTAGAVLNLNNTITIQQNELNFDDGQYFFGLSSANNNFRFEIDQITDTCRFYGITNGAANVIYLDGTPLSPGGYGYYRFGNFGQFSGAGGYIEISGNGIGLGAFSIVTSNGLTIDLNTDQITLTNANTIPPAGGSVVEELKIIVNGVQRTIHLY